MCLSCPFHSALSRPVSPNPVAAAAGSVLLSTFRDDSDCKMVVALARYLPPTPSRPCHAATVVANWGVPLIQSST
ncbi:hypothetical protein PR202_gb14252 [Eleusine coracana subsp. coracana]|uniref:Uncharacterized protein n=1 Tax=Eleusine coracana subsp. coracana TaxID=191504 RepID=A0AAV5EV02_ELECO|nr:hypothetical protein PR202_gb14252 [Eleusine coracana subsp. coracana]